MSNQFICPNCGKLKSVTNSRWRTIANHGDFPVCYACSLTLKAPERKTVKLTVRLKPSHLKSLISGDENSWDELKDMVMGRQYGRNKKEGSLE